MAGVLNVDTLKADSNLKLQVASANVAFIDVNGLTIVGNSMNIGGGKIAVTSNNSISAPNIVGANLITTSGTTALGITANGQITTANAPFILTGGQIKFPATQIASGDANTLDDYEEGTWTPIAARYTGGNITAVYGVSNAGKYTKIGRIVILECYLDITSVSSQGSSLSQVTGLPFTPSGSYAATGATFFNTAATTLNIVSCAANQGDNCIYFHESGNSGTLADFAWKAGAMTFTVIYIT